MQTSWFDVHNDVHHADDVTLARIIDVLEADRAAVWSTPRLAPALHLGASRPITVPARVERATIGELLLDVRHGDGRSLIDLPADLPFGCHTVMIDTDRGSAACVVVVAPRIMPRSAEFAGTAGLFVPTYALWEADTPLPSFRHLHQLAASDEVVRHRRRVDTAAVCDVPRRPVRSEPVLADQPAALERGVPRRRGPARTSRRRRSPARSTGGRSRRGGARNSWKRRRRLDADQRAHLATFVAEHPDVADYARFLADRDSSGDPRTEASHVLAQYLADQQLRAIADDPDAAALALDLPIGSHPAGYEVWADPSMFARGMSVGAPPDAFFGDGQDWGFPPPLPAAMHASGHRLWRELIARVGRHADILRIDHAMAVERLWWVPEGFPAHQGAYVHYPREEILAVIAASAAASGVTIVGEDLGTVPVEVSDAFDRWEMLGMYEEQFHLDDDPLPHIPARTVAGIRTHDMAPLALAVEELDTDGYRTRLGVAHQREVSDTWEDIVDEMLIRLGHSDAYLVIADLDDLLGEIRPHNLPGRVVPEIWSRRLDRPTSVTLDDPEVRRRL